MAVICFGDLHLSDERPWSLEVGEDIVYYFEKQCLVNNSFNTAIFLGDMTEKTNLTGHVYDQLLRLFKSFQFRKVYIIQGNHDIKKKKHGGYSTPLKLLEAKALFPNVELVTEVTEIEEEGLKILALPHKPQTSTFSFKEYEDIKGSYDIVVGHLADMSNKTVKEEKYNLSRIDAKHFCLGHIHTRMSPSYLGSIIPNDVSQCEQKYYRVYKHDGFAGAIMEEKKLPTFLTYSSITYPNSLPQTGDARRTAWTILNCKDEQAARAQYGDIYIRQCNYEVKIDFDQFTKYTSLTTDSASKEELVEEWLKDNKDQIPENVAKLVLKYNTK